MKKSNKVIIHKLLKKKEAMILEKWIDNQQREIAGRKPCLYIMKNNIIMII